MLKLFAFNAGTFALDPVVEGFLKLRGAISLDFGATAYVNSEAMPAILLELLEKSKADSSSAAGFVVQLKEEIEGLITERKKIIEDNARLVLQLQSHSSDLAVIKEQALISAMTIEKLKLDNVRLQAELRTVLATPNEPLKTPSVDAPIRQSYEKLKAEFQSLRCQSIDAITSLKVIEDENDELRREIDQLKNSLKSVDTKAS